MKRRFVQPFTPLFEVRAEQEDDGKLERNMPALFGPCMLLSTSHLSMPSHGPQNRAKVCSVREREVEGDDKGKKW